VNCSAPATTSLDSPLLDPNNSHNNLVSAMPGDDKSEPPLPPPTMEGLAAMMTKLLSSMGDMETRFTSMESRLQPPPTLNPTVSMPYGMPGYGSTTLASSSSTAAATLSVAPPTSSPTLPITKIPLPHSPSPLPLFDDIPQPNPLGAPGAPGAASAHERLGFRASASSTSPPTTALKIH